jgi:hypothetical protein
MCDVCERAREREGWGSLVIYNTQQTNKHTEKQSRICSSHAPCVGMDSYWMLQHERKDGEHMHGQYMHLKGRKTLREKTEQQWRIVQVMRRVSGGFILDDVIREGDELFNHERFDEGVVFSGQGLEPERGGKKGEKKRKRKRKHTTRPRRYMSSKGGGAGERK